MVSDPRIATLDMKTENIDHILRLNTIANVNELVNIKILPRLFYCSNATEQYTKFPIAFKSACGKNVVAVIDGTSTKSGVFAYVLGLALGYLTRRNPDAIDTYSMKIYMHITGNVTAINTELVLVRDISLHGIYTAEETCLKLDVKLIEYILENSVSMPEMEKHGIYLEKSLIEA